MKSYGASTLLCSQLVKSLEALAVVCVMLKFKNRAAIYKTRPDE